MTTLVYHRFFILLGILGLLSGCVHKTTPRLKFNSYSKEQEQVHVVVKPLTEQESKDHFSRNVVKRGYQPLQLTIENDTQLYYVLHPWYIGLPIAKPKKVAKKLHYNTLFTATTLVGLGLFGIEWFAPLAPLLFISIPVVGWFGYRNSQITNYVTHDAIDRGMESIVVPPFGHVTRYVFVAEKDFSPNFSLTLLSGENKPLHFDVSLVCPQPLGDVQGQ